MKAAPATPELDAERYLQRVELFIAGSFRVTYGAHEELGDRRRSGRIILYKDGYARQRLDLSGSIAEVKGAELSVFAPGSRSELAVCSPEFTTPEYEVIPGSRNCVRDDGTLAGPWLAQFGFSIEYRPPARVPENVEVTGLASRSFAGVEGDCFRLDSDMSEGFGETCFGAKGELLYTSSQQEARTWSIEALDVGSFDVDDLRLPQ